MTNPVGNGICFDCGHNTTYPNNECDRCHNQRHNAKAAAYQELANEICDEYRGEPVITNKVRRIADKLIENEEL